MKQLLLPVVFAIFGLPALAQTFDYGPVVCTLAKANDASRPEFCQECNTTPASDIVGTDGVLSGTLKVTNGNKQSIEYAVPLNCVGLDVNLTVGALRVIVGNNDLVEFDPAITVSPEAVNFKLEAFIGEATPGNPFGNATFKFGGVTYKSNDANYPTFAEAQAFVRAQAQGLPVVLMTWNAKAVGSDVELNWSTYTEEDNDFFSLEHSTDGVNFTEIAQVDGEGTTAEAVDYAYTAANPGAGIHYYRLVQQDYDGTRTTYDVLSVTLGGTSSLASIYPNPARAGERVTVNAAANVSELSLHSITGRLVKRYAATGGIDLPADLASGVYLLRAGGTTTRLLVR